MKDAPINLPPLPAGAPPLDSDDPYLYSAVHMRDYARAALLADRAGREPFGYVLTTGGASGYDFVHSKKQADKFMMLESAYRPECIPVYLAPSPAEPPAAPVQQEPVAWMLGDKEGIEFEPDISPRYKHLWTPLYTHPEADLRAELERNLSMHLAIEETERNRAERAEAERDSLRALLQRAEKWLVVTGPDPLYKEIRAALKGTP